ncbi:MAG: hypothetical protein JWN72_399 [Thermoleophilia bacterium]|nr:hypothetical protein [Thermoleophilia bacterium]
MSVRLRVILVFALLGVALTALMPTAAHANVRFANGVDGAPAGLQLIVDADENGAHDWTVSPQSRGDRVHDYRHGHQSIAPHR